MANEAAFRNAINGFNKTDVMSYIETLLLKESESNGVEASLRSKVEELTKQLAEVRERAEKIEKEKSADKAMLEASFEACRTSLAESENARREADAARREAQAELEKIKAERLQSAAEAAVADNKMPNIASVIPDACANCDKAKLYEAQLGAAMLDAKRFSEILVKEANDKVSVLLDNAGTCAVDTSKKAMLIADDIKKLTNNFNDVYSQLYKQMNTLVENLDGFAREAQTNGMSYRYRTEFVPESENKVGQ